MHVTSEAVYCYKLCNNSCETNDVFSAYNTAVSVERDLIPSVNMKCQLFQFLYMLLSYRPEDGQNQGPKHGQEVCSIYRTEVRLRGRRNLVSL